MHCVGEATFTADGDKSVPIPIIVPTYGRPCLDIRSLGTTTACFAYDPGFVSTAPCRSKISHVDDERGELLYHGYPVEQLAERCDHFDVAHLLRHGELPDSAEKRRLRTAIASQALVHQQMVRLYESFRRDARPLPVIMGIVAALSAFDEADADYADPAWRAICFARLVARMPAIVAMAYKYSVGQPFMTPRPDLGYGENLLQMLFGTLRETPPDNAVLARAVERLLIVFADYGQDAATTTVRMAGSSGANPFVCISAGIACLSGPAHGGASEACLALIDQIDDAAPAAAFVARATSGDGRQPCLPGFGDPDFGARDPRVPVLRRTLAEVIEERGLEQHRLFRKARAIEQVAFEHPELVARGLQPNAHFYAGLILGAIGLPPSMWGCLLALARTAGWLAHWEEMLTDPEYRIARPRQIYCGVTRRHLARPPASCASTPACAALRGPGDAR
ncbi:citrate/2-methylcitrate synthase [Accumulibacter sp.]|uniref:citrate/2-methylcitrate synthase n=1 Tax=Accumulibacter sp. TaxID=2053492 RepID=UPI0025E45FD3|nr:citrate/2-methylcitrate synthase [Accumulibacter sp.]MCM8596698.1 citrate (Si)-synthase [Accumulibacter sp.]MCM8624768.1 citrate (Si)-synthase [Accumulibacter sp.]MDS4050846.1 citrate/2-methylcitrate synthase [Accumulibacter sp.]